MTYFEQLANGVVNFASLMKENNGPKEEEFARMDAAKKAELIQRLMIQNTFFREAVFSLIERSDADWRRITVVVAADGKSYALGDDTELEALAAAPGLIDYNINYKDGSTYKDAEKAKLLLHCLRHHIPDRQSKSYLFIYRHLFLKYHPYLGVDNTNFWKVSEREIQEYEIDDTIITVLQGIVADFASYWSQHLSKLKLLSTTTHLDDEHKSSRLNTNNQLVLLSSDGGTAHNTVTQTLVDEFANTGKKVQIINESVALYDDPLMRVIGFPRAYNFNKIKQQANDPDAYRALNVLCNRLMPYVPDNRMDTLRHLVYKAGDNVLVCSLNTFAHDARLAADGFRFVTATIDCGVNGKLNQLVRDIVDYGFNNMTVMVNAPEATIIDRQGLRRPLSARDVTYIQYPVDHSVVHDSTGFKIELGLGTNLSVLTFGGQGCSGKARIFLQTLGSETTYPEKPNTTRDIVLLSGGGYLTAVSEVTGFIAQAKWAAKQLERLCRYQDEEFNEMAFVLDNGKTIRIWARVSQKVMYALSQHSEHFIIKPGASSSQEALQRQAGGVVVYYDGSHFWEKYNVKLLCDHGAAVVYDRSTIAKITQILQQQAGRRMQPLRNADQYPTALNVLSTLCCQTLPRVQLQPSSIPTPEVKQLQLPPPSTEALLTRGLKRATKRLIDTQKGVLKKDSDRIVSLKLDVTTEDLESFFTDFIQLIKELDDNAHESIGSPKEDDSIRFLSQFLRSAEQKLLDISNETPRLSQPETGKPIIIWSGFSAMGKSIADPNGVCNFDVPILHILFILWEDCFCGPDSLQRSKFLQLMPDDYDIERVRMHPAVRRLSVLLAMYKTTPHEIARKFFGSELDPGARMLAEKMGIFVSKLFVSRFSKGAPYAIVYGSNNKSNEFPGPTLTVNTMLWDYELNLLRQLGKPIVFRLIHGPEVVEMPMTDVVLVRNRHHPYLLNDRRSYTTGMPGVAEWLLQCAQPTRATCPVKTLQRRLTIFRNRVQAAPVTVPSSGQNREFAPDADLKKAQHEEKTHDFKNEKPSSGSFSQQPMSQHKIFSSSRKQKQSPAMKQLPISEQDNEYQEYCCLVM